MAPGTTETAVIATNRIIWYGRKIRSMISYMYVLSRLSFFMINLSKSKVFEIVLIISAVTLKKFIKGISASIKKNIKMYKKN